jgi:hypothetical protein
MVGNVELDEAETFALAEQGQAVALEGYGIIVIQVVDPGDSNAQIEQRVGDVKADKSGNAGQENVPGSRCLHGGVSMKRPRNACKRKPAGRAFAAGISLSMDVLLLHPAKAP